MKKLKVVDMHCEKCVKRISEALTNENIKFEINLEEKIVSVQEEKLAMAVETLDDLGFSAE